MSGDDEEYWHHPLAYWLRDCAVGNPPFIDESEWRLLSRRQLPLQFKEVSDGVLMSVLMKYIDPSTPPIQYHISADTVRDSVFKQKQLRTLFNFIARFYKIRLQQLIVASPPDTSLISRGASFDESIEEVNKFILLLLGCAIQSEKKHTFVDRITQFDQNIQIGLAKYIQQITEGSTIVVSALDTDCVVFNHLERIMKERDALAEITHIDNESDEGSSTTTSSSLNGEYSSDHKEMTYARLSSPSCCNRQCVIDLSQSIADARRFRKEAEEKEKEYNELVETLNDNEKEITRLRNEKTKLANAEKEKNCIRDELQAANEKIEKLKRLEDVERKLREVQHQKEVLESKYESLEKMDAEKDDAIMEMERTLEILKSERLDQKQRERENLRLEVDNTELKNEMETKNEEIASLLGEVHNLVQELKERDARLIELESSSPSFTPRIDGNLADQLQDVDRDELALLKAENRKLRAQTEGAIPEVPSPGLLAEIEALKAKLKAVENESEVVRQEAAAKMKSERTQIDRTLEKVQIELDETILRVDEIRTERDEAVKCLHEARRKFATFHSEIHKKLEDDMETKIRQFEFDLKESRRKLSQADEEQAETRFHLERSKDEQKRLRFELDEIAEEKSQLEISISQLERSRKNFESERNALRLKVEELENETEDMRLKLMNVDNSTKRLEDREKLISELQNRVGDLESEHRTLEQQLNLELKKTQQLREDLVIEKSRSAEIIGRLRSLCATVALNGGKIDVSQDDDEKLITTIDDIMMSALTTAKRESDTLRIQQNKQLAELADLRKDIEKLRRDESESLIESDDRVRELTQENINMKEQIFLLREKIRENGVEISSKNNEIMLAKSSIEELNRNATTASTSITEIARLQVSLRNAQLQEELVKQENSDLRKQLENTEKAGNKIRNDFDTVESMHKTLLSDHNRLQHLHTSLTRDYDSLKTESTDMRTKLRNAQRATPMVTSNLRELDDLRTQLAQEKAIKEKQLRAYADLQNEHGLARRQLDNLRSENEHLNRNREALNNELRRARSKDSGLQWSSLVDDLNKQVSSKDLEIAKLHHKIDALTQLNQTYNEENKTLSRQLEMLLTQNKELLQRALHDKDQYHLEMKDFQEQLGALRRHKEKLEDKIMDQYRTMENKKPGKQPLVKRAAKALISRRRTSTSNGGSTTEDSSAYSADEGQSPTLINGAPDEFDNLAPTCSSSDDHDRISPRYEQIPLVVQDTPPRFSSLRGRNDLIGGSVRLPSGHIPRRPILHSHTYDHITFNEKPLSALPPRAPVRNSSVTSSLRVRPPPPPYPAKTHSVPPPSYGSRHQDTSTSPPLFQPRCASTPKPPDDSLALMNDTNDRLVVPEGEKRTFVREKEERVDKALSYYENVNNASGLNTTTDSNDKANESTVWYEYGCV